MALILFLLLAVPLYFMTRSLLPSQLHSDLWLFVGMLISVWGNQVNRTLSRYGSNVLSKFRKPGTRPFGEILHYDYADLVALLFVALEIDKLFLASFQSTIAQLVAENFLSFPRGIDGEVHLQLFMSGFIVLPSFGVALGLYGLSRGLQLRPTRFTQLSVAFFLALACILGFVYATEGVAPFRDNYSLIQHANPGVLPASLAFAIFARVAMMFILLFSAAAYTWFFSKLGAALVRASARPYSSFTLQSVLVGLMLVTLIGAAGWRLLRRAYNHPPSSTPTPAPPGRAQIGVMNVPKLVDTVGRPLLAFVPLQNTGNQPATSIRTQVALLSFPAALSQDQQYTAFQEARAKLPFQEDGTLPAGGRRDTEVHSLQPLTQSERVAIHRGISRLYLSEVLEYTDATKIRHRTEACFGIMAPPQDPIALLGLFGYCTQGNGAD